MLYQSLVNVCNKLYIEGMIHVISSRFVELK
jgi:hypothetical protein